MGSEVQTPVQLAPVPVEDRQEVVSIDHRVLRGAEPGLAEPPSFDLTVEKAGRDT
jgi:hypothetical protein